MNQTELKKILNKQTGHNKYGNHKVHCLSKHLHDSKLEANYCNRLLAMKQHGEIWSYDTQVSFDLKINDILICRHVVDFLIHTNRKFVVATKETAPIGFLKVADTKGLRTDVFIIKHKLFKAIYPNIEYEIVSAH